MGKFTSLFAIVLVLITLQAKSQSIDFRTYQPQGTNRTQEYFQYMETPADVSHDLQGFKILLVEGIMGNYVDTVGKWFMKLFNQFDYFEDHKKWLKSVGADYQQLKIETENGSEKNARDIEAAVLDSSKPVLIFAHSKGAMDVLFALVKNPDLLPRIKGIITIQSPFLGTPVADYIEDTQPWKGIAHLVLTLLGGSGESLKDLSTSRRVKWFTDNQSAIENIQGKIAILSFGSWKDDVPKKTDSIFELSRNLMYEKMGVESDGLVPWKSAILPMGNYVSVEGLDHAATVVNTKYVQFDKARFTHALFSLLFKIKQTEAL